MQRTAHPPRIVGAAAVAFPLGLFACLALGFHVASAAAGEANVPAPAAAPNYEEHVRPILKAYCFHCHGGEGAPESGLDVRLRRSIVAGGESGPAVVPGQRGESLLYGRPLRGEMPPGDLKLSAEQIETIGRWIDAGAPTKRPEPEQIGQGVGITPEDRTFWAFQPIGNPPVPEVADRSRVRTPIDAFVLQKLTAAGLAFAADADKLTLLKRAAFDLTGLPPSEDEIKLFMADEAPDAYDRLLDRLLASPHYGERWGRHWLDVAGYADSDGYVDEDRPRGYAYKYRDYVIRAMNADRPFDQFVVEQLAGDELIAPPYQNLDADRIEKLVATGYLRMGVDGTVTAAIDEDLARNNTLGETVKIVSTGLLGLSVGCAQCHDHRYDPILQTDYYRLRAVFEPAYDWKHWRSRAERLISLYTDADRARVREVDAEVSAASTARAAKEAEHMTAALEKELEKYPAEQREALRAAYRAAADKRTPEQTQLLSANPSVNISPGNLYQYNQAAADELKKLDAEIAAIQQKKPVEDFLLALTETPGNVTTTYVFHRGDYHQPTEPVQPGELTICSPATEPLTLPDKAPELPTTGRRLAYARWLTSGRHPLVGRVIVNRIWMHHLGRGIVSTPSDFGALGERPTHPELLDWLATDFVANGWRLKRLHKLIMTSTAYRQSSAGDAPGDEVDPDNRLFGHMPVRRLDAESIRDRILVASGGLNAKMFGPAIGVVQDGVGQIVVTGAAKPATQVASLEALLGGEESRRSVYIQVRRSQPLAMLRAFDAPVMETNCDRRSTSTVATQALMLMNSEFALAEAARFAQRLRLEGRKERPAQIARAWQLAFCRSPREDETTWATEFLDKQVAELNRVITERTAANGGKPPEGQPSDAELQALTDLCHVLLSSNEFLYVD